MSRARDNANLGTQAGSGLDASDITSGALPVGVTGGSGLDAIRFLENNTSTQDLSGTYSTERLYFNDSYQLTGDVTVTGHLALGTIADADVVITNDSTARTLTVDGGVIEAGGLLAEESKDLTGMTGVLEDAVTGSPTLNLGNATFPTGHILQVKSNYEADSGSTTDTNTVNKALVFVTITPSSTSSKILILATGVSGHYAGGQYMNRGELFKDGTTSLQGTFLLISSREYNSNSSVGYAMNFMDSPSSTSAIIYSLNGASATGDSASFANSSITVMEVVV